eukprot:7360577-Pyramimonas_sp.AAC.1
MRHLSVTNASRASVANALRERYPCVTRALPMCHASVTIVSRASRVGGPQAVRVLSGSATSRPPLDPL